MSWPAGMLPALVEQLQIGVVATDAQSRITVWNSEAARLTGYPAAEAIGALATELGVSPPDREQALAQARQLLSGQPWIGEFTVVRKDGRTITLRFRATGVFDADGSPTGIVGAFDDVSRYRRREEAFALLDALFETAPIGLAYVDLDDRYRRVNTVAASMNGGSGQPALGRTVAEVHRGPVGAQIAAALAQVRSSGRPLTGVRVAGRPCTGDGAEHVWRMDFYPVRGPDGELLGIGDVVRDVTATERATRELAELSAERQHLLARYQSLLDATSAAVWTRAADGRAGEDSPSWRAVTGQTEREYLDWGFLDAVHPDDRDDTLRTWRAALCDGEVYEHVNRLRTREGGYRHFRVRAAPVITDGRVVEWIGTETDVEDEMRARRRAELLGRATAAMNTDLEPEAELRALADAVVPEFADVCSVHVLDHPYVPGRHDGPPHGERRLVVLAGRTVPAELTAGPGSVQPLGDDPLSDVIRSGLPNLVSYPRERADDWTRHPDMLRWITGHGLHSTVIAPIRSGGQVVAVLTLGACADRPRFTAEDLSVVTELAARASVAVENGRRFQQTRTAAVALQNAMLTAPPRPDDLPAGLQIEVRYLPAAENLEVGGDWYDAFALPDGGLAVVVGDVVGHDLSAATTMGQLRSMLRAVAVDEPDPSTGLPGPARTLGRLDRIVTRLGTTRFASVVLAHLHHDPLTGGVRVRWSAAGHPPPVVVDADGGAVLLSDGIGMVLGVDPDTRRGDADVDLPPGATLLLYTDGLVERRRRDVDDGIAALLTRSRAAAGMPLPMFCDALLVDADSATDDIALLALRHTALPLLRDPGARAPGPHRSR